MLNETVTMGSRRSNWRVWMGRLGAVLIGCWLSAPIAWAAGAPTTWVQSVTHDGETITLRLTRDDLRGPLFELWSQNAAGGYDILSPVAERAYIGTVDEYPGAVSCGVLQDNGTFRGGVYFDRGETWFTLGATVTGTRAVDYASFNAWHYPGAASVGAGDAGATAYAYDVGVDADNDYFTTAGSAAAAFEEIEYSVCLLRALFLKDVLLSPRLGRVVLRADNFNDPYIGTSGGVYLDAVRAEWNTNHAGTDSDVVMGVSPTKIGGGLAWVGAINSSLAYSVNASSNTGDFYVVSRHELGHNWGCSHYVGGFPEGAGIMGGNQPSRFSGCEVNRIFGKRNSSLSDLDSLGTFAAVDLPPYAALDSVIFEVGAPGVTIDVLGNDYDANGDLLSIGSHDAVSVGGATVSLSLGTGPGGRDELSYNGQEFGFDSFSYTVVDSTGQTATGAVLVKGTGPSFGNPTPVPISASGAPTVTSDILVSGISGSITDVDVTLVISHTWAEDLTITLIAPDTTRVTLCSGIGGSGDNFINTIVDDEAALDIQAGSAPFTGTFRPEIDPLSLLDGMDPNGTWTLEVADSTNNDGGAIEYWTVTLGTNTPSPAHTNSTPVPISSAGTPTITSDIVVAGLSGSITDVDVLLDVTHTFDGDLDVFLVAPDGSRISLFSDLGGSSDNFTSTHLDDEAYTSIGAASAPFTGTYRPENDALSSLNGGPPNGTWQLEIQDDGNNDGGQLNQWSVIVTTDVVTLPPPVNYCTSSPNSVGLGAVMTWSGSTSYAANDLMLVADFGAINQTGLFYYGSQQISVPFGNGVRCVGGTTDRLNPPVFSDVFGRFERPLDFLAPPMSGGTGLVLPGMTFNAQCWYRDPNGGGSGFNLSDGLSVTIQP